MVAKYKKLFFAFSALAVSFSAVFLLVKPVSADYSPTNGKCNGTDTLYEDQVGGQTVQKCRGTSGQLPSGSTSDSQNDATTDDDVTCAVEKVGWILCPIISSMAKISDNMFDVLANNFLRTDTELFRDDSGTKIAWETARNLANVMFIVAFLAIIISQVTNLGISNYGIKKMLPRLVIAAIAVNISYYICQLVVDLTNILGFEVQNALANIADDVGPSVFGQVSNMSDFETGNSISDGAILTLITAGALAGVGVWLIVGQAIAVIAVVLITALTIVIILLLRKAIIVLLIVVSPIAFVLYLLPNTEKYFSKWMKMFGQLLMVFPVVGLLFGAGQLASTIILVSGSSVPPANVQDCDPDADPTTISNPDKTIGYDGRCDGYIYVQGTKKNPNNAAVRLPDGEAASWTLGLVAMGVAVAPLVAVYSVLKGALSAAGAIGGSISSLAAKGSGAGGRWGKDKDDRINKRIQAAATRPNGSRLGGFLNGAALGGPRRRAKREAIDKSLDRELNMAKMDYTSQEALGDEGFQRQLAGGSRFIQGSASEPAMQRAVANAMAQQEALLAEEKKAARSQVDRMAGSDIINEGAHIDATGNITGGLLYGADPNSARTAAMIERAYETGSARVKAAIIDAFSHGGNTLASRTVGAVAAAQNAGFYSAAQLDSITRGTVDNAGGVTAQSMAQQSIREGRFGAEKMAKASGDDVNWARAISRGDAALEGVMRGSAAEVLAINELRGSLRNNRSHVEEMGNPSSPF